MNFMGVMEILSEGMSKALSLVGEPFGLMEFQVIVLFGSAISFALLPAQMRHWLWFLLAWFSGVAVLSVVPDNWFSPATHAWVFYALVFVPLLAFYADLLFRGAFARALDACPLHHLVFAHGSRLMAVHYLMAWPLGEVPVRFALEAAFAEGLTAILALILVILTAKQRRIFIVGVIVWNTYGLMSLASILFKVSFSAPFLQDPRFSREIFHYMTPYPVSLVLYFWIPFWLIMHGAIYYKLIRSQIEPREEHLSL